ncbi:MAG: selenium-dependent molybdenum cofactor biosynthesis protein YqeB [Candidatus Bathyarchaeia archaeon]
MAETCVLIKGGGDLASGVAHKLFNCGMKVVITEAEKPTCVRRAVSFAEAVYEGRAEVEDVVALGVADAAGAEAAWEGNTIPVLVDPAARIKSELKPDVIVDAIMAKRNTGTKITDAPIVIALGPGFTAGEDVHAVVETNRGHNLGRVIYRGEAEPNTHTPGPISGYAEERVLRAPQLGIFTASRIIGDLVKAGETVGSVAEASVTARISGVVRGLIHEGVTVRQGQKLGDIDPRSKREYCFTISDKSRCIAGSVLEAILSLRRKRL